MLALPPMATTTPPRRPGRPPAGRNGELTSEYRALSVRIPPTARRQLDALRLALARPTWAVVADALDAYATATAAERPELRAVLGVTRPARRRARA
jgi:hypothetical protein